MLKRSGAERSMHVQLIRQVQATKAGWNAAAELVVIESSGCVGPTATTQRWELAKARQVTGTHSARSAVKLSRLVGILPLS